MIDDKIPNISFKTFYASREISICPLITEIIRVIKRFKQNDLLKKNIDLSISMKYGKRVLINAKNIDFTKLNPDDFLEIVDYNPLKKVLLLMGPKDPGLETPIHWLIHHAREEVKAIIQIDNEKFIEHIDKKLPITDGKYQKGSLEQAKEILFKLRTSKVVVIKNQGLIFVGESMMDVEDSVIKTFEVIK
jgi:ribulose-5-phosphate 4-epimerase/fuculose-1-phosphate aldolase